jgi:hypothetical protein
MDQEIRQAVEELTPPGFQEFILRYLEAAEEMGGVLQLDRPLVRVNRADGGQVATVDLPAAETFIITPPERG